MGNLIRWHQTGHRSAIPFAAVLRAGVCAGQNDQAGCASPERFGCRWVSGEPALLPGPRVGRVRRRRRPCDRKSPCDRHSRSAGRFRPPAGRARWGPWPWIFWPSAKRPWFGSWGGAPSTRGGCDLQDADGVRGLHGEKKSVLETDPTEQEERFPCETFQKHGGWTQAGLLDKPIASGPLVKTVSARHLVQWPLKKGPYISKVLRIKPTASPSMSKGSSGLTTMVL